MKRTYPRVGRSSRKARGLCSCCGQPAVVVVDIEVSYMRGDDEVVKLCEHHRNVLGAGFLTDILTLADEGKARRRLAQQQHQAPTRAA